MIEEQEAKVKEKAFEFNAPYRSVYRELFCTDLSNSSLLAADQEEEVEMFELETTQDRFRPQFLAKFKNSFQKLKIKLL